MRAATGSKSKGADDLADGLLITGSHWAEHTTVEALRLEDGLPVWWYDSRLRFNDFACRDGVVFVSSMGWPRPGTLGPAQVVALRAKDGTRLWHVGPSQFRRQMVLRRVRWGLRALWMTSSPRAAWQAAKSLELAGYTYVAAAEGVTLACKGSVIFALDARTGAVRWMYPTLFGGDRRLITARDSTVYIHGNHHAIHALEARTGRVRWSNDKNFHVEKLTPSDSLVYACSTSSRGRAIMALRVADGRREQMLSLVDGEKPARVTPDGIAYLMRDARLRAVRVADGGELWQSEPFTDAPDYGKASSSSAVNVAVGEQVVFYGYEALTGLVHLAVVGGLDAASGSSLWEWRGQEQPIPITGGPRLLAAHGNVYVITTAGIFALNGADGGLLWQAPGGVTISGAVLSTGSFEPD